MEVSSKQIWDSEEYIFLPLVTELLSIKVRIPAVNCKMIQEGVGFMDLNLLIVFGSGYNAFLG